MNRANVYFPRSADEGKKDKNKNRVCSYQYAHHCTFENFWMYPRNDNWKVQNFWLLSLVLAIIAQWGKTLYEIANRKLKIGFVHTNMHTTVLSKKFWMYPKNDNWKVQNYWLTSLALANIAQWGKTLYEVAVDI